MAKNKPKVVVRSLADLAALQKTGVFKNTTPENNEDKKEKK